MSTSPTPPDHDVALDEEVLLAEARQLFGEDPAAWEEVEAAAAGIVGKNDEDTRQLKTAARLKKMRQLLHARTDDDIPTALCLSGGGIRSATFSLGVVQGLAERHLLPKFHYLSSVSGGGYLASWLSAWVRNEARQHDPASPTAATFRQAQDQVFTELRRVGRAQAQEPKPLRRLRAYSSYLSPVRGISGDLLTLLAIYTRNLTLNWLVLIPALVAALLAPRFYLAVLHADATRASMLGPWPDLLAGLALLLVFSTIAYMASDLPADPASTLPQRERQQQPPPKQSESVFLPLVAPLALAAILIVWLIVWHVRTGALPSMIAWLFMHDATCCLHKVLDWAASWDEGQVLSPRQVHSVILAGLAGGVIQAAASLVGGTVIRQVRGIESGSRPATPGAVASVFFSGCLTGIGLLLLTQGLASLARAQKDLLLLATIGVPALLWLFWFGVTLYAGWRRPIGHEDEREWFARAASHWIAFSAVWLAVFGLVNYLPPALLAWSGLKDGAQTAAVGAGTGLMGVLLAAIGYISKHGPAWLHRAETFAEKLGLRMLDLLSIVFILLLLAGLSLLVTLVFPGTPPACTPAPCAPWSAADVIHRYRWSLTDGAAWAPLLAVVAVLSVVSLELSRRFGVNAFSLHSMYGNRLVRAYLAASRPADERRPHWFTGFDPSDNLPMHELWTNRREPDEPPGPPPRLFHVINIALNIVKPSGSRLEWQDRKATSFTATPLFCGSRETGHVASSRYVASPERSGMSLGSAMTISGAAASPNMGYHSSMPLAFVMTLFNLRLGLWMPNPRWPALKMRLDQRWPWRRNEPTLGLTALLDEAWGNTGDESRFLYLSDGGHFDNMGLYEMVRRRCRRIVLVDAVADPEYTYGDLMSTLRKIRIDLGIEITFPRGLPGPADKGLSGHAIAVARILYRGADAGAPPGTLVLIKPCLPDESARMEGRPLPLDVRRYAAESARGKNRFPQQPTSDQFFDEAQFESYRMLGLHLTRNGFDDGELMPRATRPAPRATALASAVAVTASSGDTTEEAQEKDLARVLKSGASGAPGFMQQIKGNLGTIAASAVVATASTTAAIKATTPSPPMTEQQQGSSMPRNPRSADPPDAAPSAALGGEERQLPNPGGDDPRSVPRDIARLTNPPGQPLVGPSRRGNGDAGEVTDVRNGRDGKDGRDGRDGRDGTVSLNQKDADKIVDAASAAQKAAESASKAASTTSDTSAKIARYLEDIRNRIAQTPPRSNARGGTGDQ